jgi:hypothetical protein
VLLIALLELEFREFSSYLQFDKNTTSTMDETMVTSKRNTKKDQEPTLSPQIERTELETPSDDEKDSQKVMYIQETPLRLLVRCVLFLVIFTILFYFLSPHDELESQDTRIERVLLEEKLRHMQIPVKGRM